MSSEGRLDLFDSHCHLQDDRIYASRKTVVEEALGRGISRISVNGCCESDWERVTQLGREFPFPTIIPNYGLHPWFLETRSESWLTALRSALVSHPEAGLGECGLDKSPRVLERTPLDVQADLLSQQLKLGKELGRPISLHCVKAWGRMQEVLRAEGPFPSGLVMHSFQGPREVIAPLAKLGAYFSLSLSILG